MDVGSVLQKNPNIVRGLDWSVWDFRLDGGGNPKALPFSFGECSENCPSGYAQLVVWIGFGFAPLALVEGKWETTPKLQTANPNHQSKPPIRKHLRGFAGWASMGLWGALLTPSFCGLYTFR